MREGGALRGLLATFVAFVRGIPQWWRECVCFWWGCEEVGTPGAYGINEWSCKHCKARLR